MPIEDSGNNRVGGHDSRYDLGVANTEPPRPQSKMDRLAEKTSKTIDRIVSFFTKSKTRVSNDNRVSESVPNVIRASSNKIRGGTIAGPEPDTEDMVGSVVSRRKENSSAASGSESSDMEAEDVEAESELVLSQPATDLEKEVEDALAELEAEPAQTNTKPRLLRDKVRTELENFCKMEDNGLAYEESKRISSLTKDNPNFFNRFNTDKNNHNLVRQVMIKQRTLQAKFEEGLLKPNPDEIQRTEQKEAAKMERKNEKRLNSRLDTFNEILNSGQPSAKKDALAYANKILDQLKKNQQMLEQFKVDNPDFGQKVRDLNAQVKLDEKIKADVENFMASTRGNDRNIFMSKKSELTSFFTAVSKNDLPEVQRLEKQFIPNFQLKLERNIMEFSQSLKNIDQPGEKENAAKLATSINLLLKRFPSQEAKLDFLREHPRFQNDFNNYRQGL